MSACEYEAPMTTLDLDEDGVRPGEGLLRQKGEDDRLNALVSRWYCACIPLTYCDLSAEILT